MARARQGSAGARPRAGVARSARRAAVLALLVAGGCLRARGTPDEPVVVSLAFRGVKAADEDELREKLATKASDRFAWGEARRLDPDALAVDRRRVVAFYKERGYYRAAVEDVEVRPAGEGRVKVVFRIREGEPVRVARLDLEGLDAAPEARKKAGKLPLAAGKVFTWAAFDATHAQLEAALGATGYATGKVTPSALVRGEEGSADVAYRVEPGPRFRFGPISVAGTAAVPERKVVARAERVMKPGDWYDERGLDLAQARVFELGVFGGVRVTRETPDPERGEVPIDVTVREAPFRTLRIGPGIGFEPSRWEALAQISWVHRNWLGDLRRLKLDARGGYSWLPNPTQPIREGLVGTVSAELSQPGVLFGDKVDFSTKVELEKTLEQGYSSIDAKFRLGTPFRPAPRWTVVPSYNFEIYRLSDFVGDPANLPVENCPQQLCILSYLEQRVTWDLRDHPLVTTEGLFLSLSVQEGFPLGGQAYTYLRFLPEARWFTPLGAGTVLAARARAGALLPVNEEGPAPVVALFTAGGPSSMRGYGAERLSPMVNQDGTWVPTGGNGLLEGSLEVRRPLGGSLVGVLFLDAGNVSTASGVPSQWREVLDLGKLQLALGVGVRYRTSVGPFRADFAVRLPNDLSKGVPFDERFPAVPGDSGHHEPVAVIHVALGEAF